MIKKYIEFLWSSSEKNYKSKILSLVENNPDGKLLDLGCDDGEWTMKLVEKMGVKKGSTFGIEIIKKRYKLAINRGIEIREADLNNNFPFPDNTFDLVHANQVIEHIWDLDNFVAEIKRILKPKGYAIICTENLSSWHNILALVLGFQPFSLTNISLKGSIGNPISPKILEGPPYTSWFHTRVLSYSGLKDIFTKYGFKIEDYKVSGYHPFPSPLSQLLSRIDPCHGAFPVIKVRKK